MLLSVRHERRRRKALKEDVELRRRVGRPKRRWIGALEKDVKRFLNARTGGGRQRI
jgi:hypothetical protein